MSDGEKRYILAPLGLGVGDTVVSGERADIKPGNTIPLKNIPLGSFVHNVELKIGKGGQIIRSAGSYGQLMAKEGGYAQVRLPSGEVRKVYMECRATVGQVGNIDHENVSARQSWQDAMARQKAEGPRGRHEPGRPPHGRRRGEKLRRQASGTPWGNTDQRIQDEKEQEHG